MTASMHKLTAGDGYTYLTRQVAAADTTELKGQPLADYYSEKGEAPGRWRGAGLAGLGSVATGSQVSEAQMRALFGEGRHPDADAIQARIVRDATADGATRKQATAAALAGSKLGASFGEFNDDPSPFVQQVTRAYRDYNKAHGAPRDAAVPDEERARIRTEVGRSTFAEQFGRDPLDERELASHIARSIRPPRRPVAGYDVTFSPVKSVSTLWAVAPREIAEQVEAAHQAAVDDAMTWVEESVSYTRRGRGGVRQVDIQGLVTAQFTHRDSRAGDPDLHTHVAISNKVQATDGTWLALDGTPVHKAIVAASERYNTRLEAEMTRRLGVSFAPRQDDPRRQTRPVREVVGMDERLMQQWSSRRAAIDARREQLSAEFVAVHGRPPTPKEAIALAQQANLETREAKHEPRSHAEQRAQWRAEADSTLGSAGVDRMVAAALAAPRGPAPALTPSLVDDLTARVLHTVEAHRSTWEMVHVRAEAERQVRAAGVAPEDVETVVNETVAGVLGEDRSVALAPPPTTPPPPELRRRDGTSVYTRAHGQVYSSERIQAAEAALVARAAETGGHVADETTVSLALLEAAANGMTLDPGQAALVTDLATSGARLQLALAPAGSGKTTAMRALSQAWEASGGSVVGLAPSAAAATELGSSIGSDADTLSKVVWHLNHPAGTPDWMTKIDATTLVLIDEAGMAATPDLHAAVEFIAARGGSVRLVGDDQQLAAVGAGGVLRDIAEEVGVTRLERLHRFTTPAEGEATLQLRDGRPEALGFYLDQGRVHATTDTDSVLTDTLRAWVTDTDAGRDSLMLASTQEAVAALNDRARTHRLSQLDEPPAGPTVTLSTGSIAGAGDRIVTRRNDRRLRVTSTHWIKNGDRFTVDAVREDGSLDARHDATGRTVTLPGAYVAEHVHLGYATTYHGAQGSTVDTTHCAVTGQESRQLLYVGLSRGRHENHAYVAVSGDGDPHAAIHPDVISPRTAAEVLESVLRRDDSSRSARTEARDLADPAQQLAHAAARYRDAAEYGARAQIGEDRVAEISAGAERLWPGLTDAPAWETLLGRLCTIDVQSDALTALEDALLARDIGSAQDPAAVLDWRLDESTEGPLPWLPAVPSLSDPQWSAYVEALATETRDMATAVADRAAADAGVATLPQWAEDIGPDLRRRLAVWRAAMSVPAEDGSPGGPPRLSVREKSYQHDLHERVARARGAGDAPGAWSEYIDPRAVQDRYYPVLAARLDAAARTGVDVVTMLRQAQDAGPLPDEHPAAALASRVTAAITPDALSGSGLRPTWCTALLHQLGETHAATVLSDRVWPALVETATLAQEHGRDPEALLAFAASTIDLPAVGTPQGLPHEVLTQTLLARVQEAIQADLHSGDADDPPPPEDEWEVRHPHEWMPLPAQDPATIPVAGEAPPLEQEPPHDDAPEHEAVEDAPATARARVLDLTSAAAQFFTATLEDSPEVAAYLADRTGGADLTGYVVGYAPSGWTGLIDHLRQEHAATDSEMVDAGLAKWSRRGTVYDVFRDRLVFGLHDADGALTGFVGRSAPGADNGPKYLNTPETDVFHKRAVLFGLHEEREALAGGAAPCRVEGVLDALAVTGSGGGRVVGVAPLGTALSETQLDQIVAASRPSGLVLEAPDQDEAGSKAAVNDYWAFRGRDVHPRVLPVLAGDPASFRDEDPTTFATVLAAAEDSPPLASLVIDRRLAVYEPDDLRNPASRVTAARDAAAVIASTPVAEWPQHVTDTCTRLGDVADQDLVWSEVLAASISWTPTVPDTPADTTPAQQAATARQALLARVSELEATAPGQRGHEGGLRRLLDTLDSTDDGAPRRRQDDRPSPAARPDDEPRRSL